MPPSCSSSVLIHWHGLRHEDPQRPFAGVGLFGRLRRSVLKTTGILLPRCRTSFSWLLPHPLRSSQRRLSSATFACGGCSPGTAASARNERKDLKRGGFDRCCSIPMRRFHRNCKTCDDLIASFNPVRPAHTPLVAVNTCLDPNSTDYRCEISDGGYM